MLERGNLASSPLSAGRYPGRGRQRAFSSGDALQMESHTHKHPLTVGHECRRPRLPRRVVTRDQARALPAPSDRPWPVPAPQPVLWKRRC